MTPQEKALLTRIRVWGGMAISAADVETAGSLEAKGYIVLEQGPTHLIALTAERAAQERGAQ